MVLQVSEQKKLKQEYTDNTLKIEQLAHDIESAKNSSKNSTKQLDALLHKHDWIGEERQYFGQQNSAYDFTQNDPKETSRQMAKLTVCLTYSSPRPPAPSPPHYSLSVCHSTLSRIYTTFSYSYNRLL